MVSQGSHGIVGAVGSEVEDFYLSRHGRGGELQRAGEGAAAADTRPTLDLEENRSSPRSVILRLRPGHAATSAAPASAGPKDLARDARGPAAAAAPISPDAFNHLPVTT
jgi:hypothetical protein